MKRRHGNAGDVHRPAFVEKQNKPSVDLRLKTPETYSNGVAEAREDFQDNSRWLVFEEIPCCRFTLSCRRLLRMRGCADSKISWKG